MPGALTNPAGALYNTAFGGGGAQSAGSGAGAALNAVGGLLSLAPGVGSVVGSVVGALGGLLGGGATTDWATGRFDGYHSATLPRLDDSTIRNGDADVYLRFAKQYGHSVEAVKALMEQDMRVSGNTWAYVFDAWRMPTWNHYQSHIDLMQRMNPKFDFYPAGKASTAPVSSAQLPYNGVSGLPSSMSFTGGAPSNSLTTKDVLNGAWNGALDGVTGVFLDTPQGKAAQNQGAIDWAKDNWYIPLGIVTVIGTLAGALIAKK